MITRRGRKVSGGFKGISGTVVVRLSYCDGGRGPQNNQNPTTTLCIRFILTSFEYFRSIVVDQQAAGRFLE